MSLRVDAERFRAWARLCADSLGAARAEIDALNVFPVPDADTGTNAYLTFEAGAAALAEHPVPEKVPDVLKRYGEGLLMGAKGNSGTILSELIRGSLRVLRSKKRIGASDVVEALTAASKSAYAAVGDPQEGTILTVAAAAAEGARLAEIEGLGPREVFDAAARAAREALILTPTQMDMLAKAGVVDAGGRALVVVLDSLAQALTGRVPSAAPANLPMPIIEAGTDLDPSGPSYEVMYLLRTSGRKIGPLRERLTELGDSLVVVGGEGLWNVHVHVDDVGAAIEAGLKAGRPFRIAVTHFADEITAHRRAATGRVVIMAVTGPGLAEIVTDAGGIGLEFTAEEPLTVSRMTDAIAAANVGEVLILPNRDAHISLFEAAAKVARDAGTRVAVLRTTVQMQGLAALAVHDPGQNFDDDVVTMSTAVGAIRHGAVTIAKEDGFTSAGPCRAGDVLGVVQGDFATVGNDPVDVAMDVYEQLDIASAEIVSMIVGADTTEEAVTEITRRIAEAAPHADIEVHRGDQSKYLLFLAVE